MSDQVLLTNFIVIVNKPSEIRFLFPYREESKATTILSLLLGYIIEK